MTSKQRREAVFLFIGVVTPVGILAVNGSAYVMQHLDQFRLILAISALVSSLFLQGLAAYALLAAVQLRVPSLYAEYRRWAIGIAVAVVVIWSSLGAWGTYVSMKDPLALPDGRAVLVCIGLLALPFVTVLFGRWLDQRRTAQQQRADHPSVRQRASRPR